MAEKTSGWFRFLLLWLSCLLIIGGGCVLWWRIEKRNFIQRTKPGYTIYHGGRSYFQDGPVKWVEQGERYDADWRRVGYICLGTGLLCGLALPLMSRRGGMLVLLGVAGLLFSIVQHIDAYPSFGLAVKIGTGVGGLAVLMIGILLLTHKDPAANPQ